MRMDCRMWSKFLIQDKVVCRPFVDISEILQADDIDFASDAAGSINKGFGCLFDTFWCFGCWDAQFMEENKPTIDYLELCMH